MNTGLNISAKRDESNQSMIKSHGGVTAGQENPAGGAAGAGRLVQLPAAVRESVVTRPGEYDARRLRSQREVIRDVMLAAAQCNTWLTLGELRALTRYGEASISAQLRHLRKLENGGYEVVKRHREGAATPHVSKDGRGECVWEYHVARLVDIELGAAAVAEDRRGIFKPL